MTERLRIIYSHVGSGKVFADVGCDHGYISKAVLDDNKFEKVIISDISSQSLQKAVELLKPYGNRVTPIVSDGFKNYTDIPDEAVIAGMGGEEIVKILSDGFMPKSLVLAPQKNTDKLRRFLVENGYNLVKDYTFYSQKKFYDLILAKKGEDFYLENEIEFGRDNLKDKPEGFILKLKKDVELFEGIISNSDASTDAKQVAKAKLLKLKELLK